MKKIFQDSAGHRMELVLDIFKNKKTHIRVKRGGILNILEQSVSGIEGFRTEIDLVAEVGANIYWYAENGATKNAQIVRGAKLETGAKLNFVEITDGGGRIEFNAELIGKNSSADVHSLAIAGSGGASMNKIEISHLSGGTCSSVSGYAIVQSNAEHAWIVGTTIQNAAKKSVASQSINNLLIGENGTVKNRPALIIRNNDVTCTHSVATGHLDEEQLFYAQSRGITLSRGRILMARGFVEPVLRLLPKCVEREFAEKLDNLLQKDNA